MKKRNRILLMLSVMLVMIFVFSIPAFAMSESDVQAQVDAHGKEAVTGNVFIWFLCAIAFLKVSQKIDSFMSSLGINVGHTGGSMLGEAMIAARGIATARNFAGGGGHASGGGGGSGSGSSGGASFASGGLAGVVSRSFTNSAVKKATGSGGGGLGGKAYDASVNKGGGFANNVIGKVATGNISSTGSMTGKGAEDALMSYMGYTALEQGAADIPSYSNVEIGGGRIMATETSAEHPEGISIGMYHTDQYMAPSGEYSTVTAKDGTTWYKQYATDTVQRTPYKAPDNTIAYKESIVKKLPDPPRRKDRV